MSAIEQRSDARPGGAEGHERPVWMLTVAEFRYSVEELVRKAIAEGCTGANDGLLTLEQTAKFLGCSVRHLHRLREAGLPTIFLIDSPRFERAAILEFLRNQARQQ